MKKNFILVFVIAFIHIRALSQQKTSFTQKTDFAIEWDASIRFNMENHLHFVNAFYKPEIPFPFFSTSLPISSSLTENDVEIVDAIYENVSDFALSPSDTNLSTDFKLHLKPSFYKGKASMYVEFIPLRKNPSSGQLEKLISFNLRLKNGGQAQRFSASSNRNYVSNSVLSTGDWFKIAITQDGVYKLSYDFLKSKLKMDLNGYSPSNFRLFGNGGGILPELNTIARIDDLAENAVYVYDGGTVGKWDDQDYILFYGQSPVQWSYSQTASRFVHQANYYSDSTFYFLTLNGGNGSPKRIQTVPSLNVTPDFIVNSFDDYQYHELDRINFVKSGREFYGEAFDVNPNQTFSFKFPNILQQNVLYKTGFAAHSPGVVSSASAKYNSQVLFSGNYQTGTSYTDDYAQERFGTAVFLPSSGDEVNITYSFNAGNTECSGFLNYIELQARRALTFVSVNGYDQLMFRDLNSFDPGKTALFNIASTPGGMRVWNVTNPINVSEQLTTNGSFITNVDSLQQFIAFGGTTYFSPLEIGKIPNQNLHALSQVDYIIITNPLFEEQATRIASFHRDMDNFSSHVVNVDLIYNEFSSGSKDVTALRDFIKMFYDRGISSGTEPQYVLLVGDGSYDNKYRRSNNTNFLPTYQSENAVSFLNSFVSDDYFVLMDDNEGLCAGNEKIDLGIGRLPVQTVAEAKVLADKIINYSSAPQTGGCEGCNTSNGTLGDWRNVITFVADDEDGSLHVPPTENFANAILTKHKIYNVDKIYLDAFKQMSTPAGNRYPDVNDAVNKRINKGTLIMNYVGHGGETGWAEERVLTNDDINSWTNINKLPVFITATCEFSRWDDPARISSGEKILLSATGGGVALFSTTRLVYASSNATLNESLLRHMFDDAAPRLGDIYRASKIEPGNLNSNTRNFSLLGDPALKLHYPKYSIEAAAVNATPITALNDTLSALKKITISGVVSLNGQVQNNFNGFIYPSVYDKPSNISMLRNDPSSPALTFKLQKNILYKGKATVKNGLWSFTFVVPKDISYQYGLGKLSFYAENGVEDGAGYYDSIVVGGSSGNIINDADGPTVKLFLNNDRFVFGGTTNDKPVIYCQLSDSTGINTVGNGVGHDITAILDGKTEPVYVLNDYYEADLDSYTSGKISYPLAKLSDGRHTLKIKAWDILNNSSEAYTEFIVASSSVFALNHVLNYPNPFTTHTQFSFEYNKPCENLDAQIQIYTISGKLIKTISRKIISAGTRIDELTWDGRDDFGDKIGRGVYIYRVKLNNAEGESASKIEKLVILK